tara:strand:+ start:19336 stop:22089 length:2754 start_codon:yes stop_codon:yes gene_type:complete
MNTQLVLYPQVYDNISLSQGNAYLTDGLNFNSITNYAAYNTTGSIDAHLTNTPPAIINTWYRWNNTLVSTPADASVTSQQLYLNSVTPSSYSGVYQQLSFLTVGVSYTVTINMTATTGIINPKVFNPNTNAVIQGQLLTANTTQQTLNFVAQTPNDIVTIVYYNTANSNLIISSITVTETPASPSGIYAYLIDGQVDCDLYQEEDIPLSLSIDNFKNVAEKVQSYSKDFNLPATKRNNQIFNNMFDVTRANDGIIFNPYMRTKCALKQDGIILFEGYLRLINVKDNEGEISYDVNLYSDVIALADTLKDKKFADLNFTELNHLYDKDSIKNSWDNAVGLPLINQIGTSSFAYDASLTSPTDHTNVLKYPFIDWTGQIFPADGSTGSGATADLPELISLEGAFRPCIQLKYLINKIFSDAGFDYTSAFFDTADFEKLFMDFNWGSASVNNPELTGMARKAYADTNFAPTGSYGTVIFNLVSSVIFFPPEAGFNTSTSVFTSTADNTKYEINYEVRLKWLGTTDVTIEWYSDSDGVIDQATFSGSTASSTQTYSGTVTTILNNTQTLKCRFNASTGTNLVRQSTGSSSNTYSTLYGTVSPAKMTDGTILNTLRGELGQWEFLKGIFTMFNLVTMRDETNPNNILIEPYKDVFINNTNSGGNQTDLSLSSRFDGKVHDWTDKIDVSEMELKPLSDLNKETIFKFVEDDEDIAFDIYRNSTGKLYGSREFDSRQFTILEGEKEIIAEPFAATVCKPLFEQFSNFIVPCVFTKTGDGAFEGFDNSPRIFYNNGVVDTGLTYFIPSQNGKFSENQSDFLQFSHLSEIETTSTTVDFNFGTYGYIMPIGQSAVNNLYSTYWQPYFNELYHPDTRVMTLKVNLNPSDIATFKFYDVVYIKNRPFRVNRIDYKPNDLATVEFILIP